MTLGFGFGAGLAALRAAQLGMQTAGNNVANANTPGYSRQRVELGTALSYGIRGNLQVGAGVDVNGISRMVDDGLERRIQFQLGLVGAAELDNLRYREIETIFAEPDDGLSSSYKDLFGALDQVRTDPSSTSSHWSGSWNGRKTTPPISSCPNSSSASATCCGSSAPLRA